MSSGVAVGAKMRRFFWVLAAFLLACGSGLAGSKDVDKSVEHRIADFKSGKKPGSDKVRVIIQTVGDPDVRGVSDVVSKAGGKAVQKFGTFDGLVAEVPVSQLERVRNHPATVRISEDLPVKGHSTTGTTFDVATYLASVDVDRLTSGAPNSWFANGVAGQHIGVAVLDSGIAPGNDLSYGLVQTVDMITGSTTPSDPFGHGTHVGGILAGIGINSNYTILGTAPMASLYNIRVLDENGRGLTSTVIAGIEWVIKNRNRNKEAPIRVINLSLGHVPMESASTDPLTLACRKAVSAGIVVVVSAGNYGQDSSGNTVYGGITSPGTEPSVITVGAMNTHKTATRADDTLASYSSRGPTIDGLIKPDIVAPGSRIVAPMAPNNKLAAMYPKIVQNANYMKLSGTSMAAPFVSGAVALILNKNPGLTPNAVKAILMYTAERIGRNPLDVGAGYLNVFGAVNLAASVDSTKPVSQYWITNGAGNLTQTDTVGGYTIVWGGTIVWGDSLYSGNAIYYNQKAWANTILWGDSSTNWSTTIVWDTSVSALNALISGQTIVWDETIVWDDTIVWEDLIMVKGN